MESPWYSLMTNVAVVAFVVSAWTQLRDVFERFGPRATEAAFGGVMGLGAIAAMLFPVQFEPGTFFDLRTCLLALAAFFGGPLAGLIAAALAIVYRLSIGGPGLPAGLAAIGFTTLAALLGYGLRRKRGGALARWHSLALALATCVIGVAVIALAPAGVRAGDWLLVIGAQTLLLFLAVLLSGLALTRDEELRAARRDNQNYRQAIDERQRVLSFAMAQMSDGVAMFDRGGRLLFCNSQYQQLFPLSSDVRVPGAELRHILATAVERREQQVDTAPADIAAWIEEVASSLDHDSEEEVHLFDGSWLRVSTRPSPDGVSMVVVSDITRLKHAALELLDVTERLRQEATTDALTGLVNRRALDQRLEVEIARSLRSDAAISVVMLDIDHFKAYNDTYGHLAGDACLKTVSQCLGQVFQRPADLVARYGGEEFVVVLPEITGEVAHRLADEYRSVLKGLALPHQASPIGHVTVSLGVASYAPGETERSAAELVGRADEALYAAKTGGRDRVSTWRRRFDLAPRSLRVVR